MTYKNLQAAKIHFTSLGCARNLVDTEVMLAIVLKAGCDVIEDPERADYLVVNTCGFLEASRQEALDTLEDLFSGKKEDAKVIVTGCMVRKHRELLLEHFPEIHYFLGSGDVEKIMEAILADEFGESVSQAKSYLEQGEVPRVITTPSHYAYLKIAEGCKKRCSFCIIPTIKGKLQSKTEKRVISEAKALIASGVKEVILIAQDLGDFAKDRGERDGLEKLLAKLVKLEGDFWIRLLYLYPDEITEGIIELIRREEKICPYLDMPIQHINDRILKKMHRKTNRADIIRTIEKLREKVPGIVIRTSLMVGFPSETEEEFQELIAFVKEYQLDNIGFFTYSNEKEAYSYHLADQVPEKVKERRMAEIAAVQKEIAEEKGAQYIGRKLKVLVEGHHPESDALLVGRFYGQCPDIDGEIIINDWQNVKTLGEFYEVEITDATGYDLLGRAEKRLSSQKNPFALVG